MAHPAAKLREFAGGEYQRHPERDMEHGGRREEAERDRSRQQPAPGGAEKGASWARPHDFEGHVILG